MMRLLATLDGVRVRGEADTSPVPWWSFTKPVLAVAALSLVRDGLARLDDALPGAPYTLRQLLRHEAGWADYGELHAYHHAVGRGEPAWPADDMVRRLDAVLPRDRPGTRWRYSNVGYLKVAELLSARTGLDLADALQQRVLVPLGLTRTRLARTRADLDGVTMGAVSGYDPGWVYHGLLVGPLEDAAGFLTRLFGGGLLPAPLLQAMQSARPLGGPLIGRPWVSAAYGLGLMQGEWAGGMRVQGHTGSGPGSSLAVYHHRHGGHTVCVAVFAPGATDAGSETAAARLLFDVRGRSVPEPTSAP